MGGILCARQSGALQAALPLPGATSVGGRFDTVLSPGETWVMKTWGKFTLCPIEAEWGHGEIS